MRLTGLAPLVCERDQSGERGETKALRWCEVGWLSVSGVGAESIGGRRGETKGLLAPASLWQGMQMSQPTMAGERNTLVG